MSAQMTLTGNMSYDEAPGCQGRSVCGRGWLVEGSIECRALEADRLSLNPPLFAT